MIKVLDLFSGTQSVKKALKDYDIDYIGIDILNYDDTNNIILDLSQDSIVEKLVDKLPKDWKPDFIWSSPICNYFSIATAVKGGNVYFEKTVNGIKPRENLKPLRETQFKNYTLEKIQDRANLSITLVKNTIKIIEYFNVDYVMENPQKSYIKYYLPVVVNGDFVLDNTCSYCRYGFDYQKHTNIYSNMNLGLKICNHNGHNSTISYSKLGMKSISNYSERASVPPKLIESIFNKFKKSL